jgi:outer membrane protein assembly factor BamB
MKMTWRQMKDCAGIQPKGRLIGSSTRRFLPSAVVSSGLILAVAGSFWLNSVNDAFCADWRPVDQPNLAAAFEAAPELKFEELADGPDTCWQGPLWWVPNSDGKTWDFVFVYYPQYPGPNEVFIYDTGTRELKKSSCPELVDLKFGFHLNRFYMLGGKAHIAGGYGPVSLFVYDPDANDFRFGGYPMGQDGDRAVFGTEGLVTANDDGTLLGGFGPLVNRRKQVAFYTVDPVTLKADFIGPVGPENPSVAWEYRHIVMDGDWIYASLGHSPWRLYAVNTKTRQGQVIAETERFMGERNTIRFIPNPNYPGIYVSITGMKGGPRDKTQAFWLRDGKMTPCEPVGPNVIPTPPWTEEKLAKPKKNFTGAMDEADLPPAGLEVFRGPVDLEGRVRCWYRFKNRTMAEAAKVPVGEWQKIELPGVKLHPAPIRRMAALSDGSLFALTEGYGRAVRFEPKSGKRTTLGPTMSVYSLLPFEEKLYLCGYPSSAVWAYDPAKPWTVGRSPDAPPAVQTGSREIVATPDSNPSSIATLKDFTDVHMPMASAVGADGRVYFGGKVVRIGNGGGLGWWDPRDKKGGGLHEPFDNYAVFWMCAVDHGRYIVCSTKAAPSKDNPDFTPPRGRLFVYDTTRHEITRQVEDERLFMPGYITEAIPGLVMGYTGAKEGGQLYGFDPATGKFLWTKPVPRAPSTGISTIKKARYTFTKGPDGNIWATMDGALARINPHTAEVQPVGKLVEDEQICFLDGDVYVSGSTKFRRLTGIPKVTAPK